MSQSHTHSNTVLNLLTPLTNNNTPLSILHLHNFGSHAEAADAALMCWESDVTQRCGAAAALVQAGVQQRRNVAAAAKEEK